METFEWIIGLMFGAAVLSTIARRLALPYPSLLAVGGAATALLPSSPDWTLDPQLALVLFVAPVLLDAAFDFSLRDLKRTWVSVAGLAIVAVILTTASVALVAHWLVPDMPWPVAIALGAIVAPPDAAAATAVMQRIRLPRLIRTVLEGESLINDASALLIYRLAVGAALTRSFSPAAVAPMALFVIIGSVCLGFVVALILRSIVSLLDDVPTSIVLQFISTFGIWMLADRLGLSPVLTIVVSAIIVARSPGRLRVSPHLRIPTNAVWAVVVFMLNAFAFVLIGMQLRPLLTHLGPSGLSSSLLVAVAVLLTAVVARFAWVLAYSLALRLRGSKLGRHGEAPAARSPFFSVGLIMSWAGMRGIVTLATALALPTTLADGSPFPYRDLVLLCAFIVVLGTLVVQGLTLGPLIALFRLEAPDPAIAEVRSARAEALRAGLLAIDGNQSHEAMLLRKEFGAIIETSADEAKNSDLEALPGNDIRRTALAAARKRSNELWLEGTIGDEAYRTLESEFDWGELGAGV